MQKTVFCGKFDVAGAETGIARRGIVEGNRQRRRQLQIGRRAIVEIDPRGTADVAARAVPLLNVYISKCL